MLKVYLKMYLIFKGVFNKDAFKGVIKDVYKGVLKLLSKLPCEVYNEELFVEIVCLIVDITVVKLGILLSSKLFTIYFYF